MAIIFGLVLLTLVLGTIIFVNTSPEFGGKQPAENEKKFALTKHYKEGRFINLGNVDMKIGLKDYGKSLLGYFNPPKGAVPNKPILTESISKSDLENYSGETRLFWFGHSTFLLQIQSKNILIDPMFGDVPSPIEFLGTKRFSDHLPIDIDSLPTIDAVLISHDHYDHLDYGSIIKLKGKVNRFYTPLGVGAHLESWGVKAEKIIELDWWEHRMFSDLQFVCTPAQHFSGRGLTDKGKTLWSSWVIKSDTETIFFSGDSGYGPHFKDIGEKFGPFDFAMMECGQYNTLWHEIHMYPEETAQAALDVKAKRMMPIHWGAFKLAMHGWNEPVERLEKVAKLEHLNMVIPKIGEPILVNATTQPSERWWE
ncbi:MBL fold metallo-hydrolase [Formosa haliotis]|uniref:MBL fold metallo-hydrolase n=1 Tax=Formosa haliotis TaxID=1555194 RepID=UPI000825BC66|nr:MBL fold metallo-hydrolase [Formosa haliotis]